ncbi:MAG TPA: helix-hairpin-helix domain-containing protein [Bryobacteraceae bacterium]|nr:helix-hairpin-helix domain-containing protein [Bryobacteraceae bacterium]
MRYLLLLVLLLAAADAQRRDEVWAELLPPGNGHGAVVASCTGCHSLKVVVNARRTPAEWAATVDDMIQRGAPAFPDEIEAMTAFLAKSFPATAPRLVNVNTARREELEKLPGMNPEAAARIVAARSQAGIVRNPEDLRRALGMEKAEFEKILYLFKYSD